MPLFSARLDYALRAVVDLAMLPPGRTSQSREVAARQDIRGPYLDQILAVLKRDGIVRSVRGAGGGYALARRPHQITIGQVVRAMAGDDMLISAGARPADPTAPGAAYVVRQFEEKMERQLRDAVDGTTVADLVAQKQRLDDSLSIMPGI